MPTSTGWDRARLDIQQLPGHLKLEGKAMWGQRQRFSLMLAFHSATCRPRASADAPESELLCAFTTGGHAPGADWRSSRDRQTPTDE